MNWAIERHDLQLSTPFGIARGTSETSECVTVSLSREGTTGYGAATPSAYYGETAASVAAVLPELLELVEGIGDPHAGQRIERQLRERAPDQPAARSAVDIAVADLAARELDIALYRQLGLDPERLPETSYTVGIDPPERMAEKAKSAVRAGFATLKVKLGTDDDRARFEAVCEAVPDATIRVDANAAWDVETAIAAAEWLDAGDVELLEQPVAGDDIEGLARVTEATPIPVCADESCQTAADVPRVADACDVVNAKLVKCGGLRAAKRLVHTADAHGLATMLGCMVESNASIAAAVHLAPLFEFADLDGALLLDVDPFAGVAREDSQFALQRVSAGTGARRR